MTVTSSTDFQNCFTTETATKFATKLAQYFPPQLKHGKLKFEKFKFVGKLRKIHV